MNKFKYTISLEDSFNGVDYTLITSKDPVITLMGGACTFNNIERFVNRAKDFLEDSSDVEKARTNNPTLVDECKKVAAAPVDTAIVICHNDLSKLLSPDENKAILYHEIGHIHHDHSRKMMNGTAGNAVDMEIQADQYAVDQVGPKVLAAALEKCLTFGAKHSIVFVKEMAPAYIRVLLNNGVINKFMIGSMYRSSKKTHNRRFQTLSRLEKELNK